MKKFLPLLCVSLLVSGCAGLKTAPMEQQPDVPVGYVEVVAELPINPGNIAVTQDGRIFATVHQFRRADVQLMEVTGYDSYEAWPDKDWNGTFGSGPDVFNSVLGIKIDRKKRLWVIDNGNGPTPQTPKLLAFDLDTRQLVFRYDVPESVGPKGSFIQDLAVDDIHEFVYLADAGGQFHPGLIIVDLKNKTLRRFEDESLNAEPVDLVVEGQTMMLPGKDGQMSPARVGVNPITISGDGEHLYYGAMNGETWYRVPAKNFRDGQTDEYIRRFIYAESQKPVSDGASTDAWGQHYFTDLKNNAIVMSMGREAELETLVQDDRLMWPDALSFGESSWLYIAVNQLHRSAFLNNGVEAGQPPYLILRVWTGAEGIPGR